MALIETQMLNLVEKEFKEATGIVTVFKEQRNTMFKEFKETMFVLTHQIENISKDMEIIIRTKLTFWS